MKFSKSKTLLLSLSLLSSSALAWDDWIVKSGPPPSNAYNFSWLPSWSKSTYCPISPKFRGSPTQFFNDTNGTCNYTHRTSRSWDNGDDASDNEWTLYCDPASLPDGKTCTGTTQPEPEPAYACTDNNSSNPPTQLNISSITDLPLYQNTGKYAHKGCLYTPTSTPNTGETYTQNCYDFSLTRIDDSQPDITNNFQNDLSDFQCEVEPEPEPEQFCYSDNSSNPPLTFSQNSLRALPGYGNTGKYQHKGCLYDVTFTPNTDEQWSGSCNDYILTRIDESTPDGPQDFENNLDNFQCEIPDPITADSCTSNQFFKEGTNQSCTNLITSNYEFSEMPYTSATTISEYEILTCEQFRHNRTEVTTGESHDCTVGQKFYDLDEAKQYAISLKSTNSLKNETCISPLGVTHGATSGRMWLYPNDDCESQQNLVKISYSAITVMTTNHPNHPDNSDDSNDDGGNVQDDSDLISSVEETTQQVFDSGNDIQEAIYDVRESVENLDLSDTTTHDKLEDINNTLTDTSTTFSTAPTDSLTGFYASEYPNGFDDVWQNNSAAFENSPTKIYIESWKIEMKGTYVYPQICLDLGIANFGCHQITIDPRVFPFIRILLIITALITARQITLGA